MSLKEAVKTGAGFLQTHLAEFLGGLLVFLAGFAAYRMQGEYTIYSVAASSALSVIIIAYLENVKYGWVDKD